MIFELLKFENRRMKVLWLSNSPCSSVNRCGGKTIQGGWLISLESEVVKNNQIDLSIAYLSRVSEPSFDYNGTHYYPVLISNSNNKGILNTLLSSRMTDGEKEKLAIPQIISIINKVKPDIVHIHGTEELWGKVSELVDDVPFVFSIQGLIAPIKEKYFSGISKSIAFAYDSFREKLLSEDVKSAWKSLCYRAPRELGYLSKSKYIFGRTFWDKACTLAINPNRMYFEVNEIMRPTFYSNKWEGNFDVTQKIIITSTISSGVFKGLDTVAKAAKILSEYSSFSFEWHIIGYKENSKWAKMVDKETGIDLKQYPIVFHGRIPEQEVSRILCSSDMYVHVSHIENSPNSVCEAMMLGMPVIATFAGGTASLLRNGVDGLLFQDGDPYVLAGMIVELALNPELAKMYGESAHSAALERHRPEKVYQELIQGYNSILEDYHNENNRHK